MNTGAAKPESTVHRWARALDLQEPRRLDRIASYFLASLGALGIGIGADLIDPVSLAIWAGALLLLFSVPGRHWVVAALGSYPTAVVSISLLSDWPRGPVEPYALYGITVMFALTLYSGWRVVGGIRSWFADYGTSPNVTILRRK